MSHDHVNVPADRSYTKDHEWLKLEASVARVGITDFAQHELGDIVHIELPEVGRDVKAGDPIAVIESVKSVSDVYAPSSGTITAVHECLDPARVNADPYGEGWLFEMTVVEPGTLLSADTYRAQIAS